MKEIGLPVAPRVGEVQSLVEIEKSLRRGGLRRRWRKTLTSKRHWLQGRKGKEREWERGADEQREIP